MNNNYEINVFLFILDHKVIFFSIILPDRQNNSTIIIVFYKNAILPVLSNYYQHGGVYILILQINLTWLHILVAKCQPHLLLHNLFLFSFVFLTTAFILFKYPRIYHVFRICLLYMERILLHFIKNQYVIICSLILLMILFFIFFYVLISLSLK